MGAIGNGFEAVYNVVSKYESDERLLETICRGTGYNKFVDLLGEEGINYQIAKVFILPVLYYGDFPKFCAEVNKSDFGMEFKGLSLIGYHTNSSPSNGGWVGLSPKKTLFKLENVEWRS